MHGGSQIAVKKRDIDIINYIINRCYILGMNDSALSFCSASVSLVIIPIVTSFVAATSNKQYLSNSQTYVM